MMFARPLWEGTKPGGLNLSVFFRAVGDSKAFGIEPLGQNELAFFPTFGGAERWVEDPSRKKKPKRGPDPRGGSMESPKPPGKTVWPPTGGKLPPRKRHGLEPGGPVGGVKGEKAETPRGVRARKVFPHNPGLRGGRRGLNAQTPKVPSGRFRRRAAPRLTVAPVGGAEAPGNSSKTRPTPRGLSSSTTSQPGLTPLLTGGFYPPGPPTNLVVPTFA
ncbi:hypothetical protein [Pseudomonas phage vB_Pae_CF63a]|nr:hypothetical protein [Pseudomonas phage vB_Pae_CF63a]